MAGISSFLYFLILPTWDAQPKAPFLQPWHWAPTSLGHSHFSAVKNKWPSDEGQLRFVRKQWHSWPPNCRALCLVSIWVRGDMCDQSCSTDLGDLSTCLKVLNTRHDHLNYCACIRDQWQQCEDWVKLTFPVPWNYISLSAFIMIWCV